MPIKAPVQQYSFTSGQLDDSLAARIDLDRYYKGGLDIRNFILLSQGGLERRGGLVYCAEVTEAAAGARLAAFKFSTQQAYLHVFVGGKIKVYMDGVLQADVTSPYGAADLSALDWTQGLDTMLISHAAFAPRSFVRTGSNTSWSLNTTALSNIPTYTFGADTTNTGTPSAITGSVITFTAGGAEFAAGDVGKWIIGNQGKAKITAYTSSTVVSCSVKQDFKTATAIAAGDWSIEEDAWSAARGWPGSVALYQGRSYWAGSKQLLQTAWGSRSDGKLFSFKSTWEALDDEAVEAGLDGESVNAIQRVVGLDSLYLFTTGGTFAVTDSPITPKLFVPTKQTAVPAVAIRPVEIEDTLVFIAADEDAKATTLHELVINASSNKTRYMAQDLNVLAGNVVKFPVGMASRQGRPDQSSASHVFIVNADGTIAVLHMRRSENVLGWTQWDTIGNSGTDGALDVAVVAGVVYFLVRRTINGVVRYFIEKQDDTAFFDCSVKQTATTAKSVWGGFGHLVGETLKVWADGALRDDVVVDGAGQITVTDDGAALPVTTVEAGMPLMWAAETMPIEAQLQNGTFVGEVHKLVKATVRVRGALDMSVNGRKQVFRAMQGMTTDAPPVPFTGLKTVRLLGWTRASDRGATVRMTGFLPIVIEAVTTVVAQ